MKRIFTYGLLLFVLLAACEDVYEPDIDVVESVLVADARISADEDFNTIHLYKSVAYYDNVSTGPGITNAHVTLIDDNGDEHQLSHYSEGWYSLNLAIDPALQYKLKIEYEGDVYESTFEEVPKTPSMDTVFGIEEIQVRQESGENDVDNFRKVKGIQLYTDIASNPEMPYFRFTARFILLYTYPVDIPGPFGSVVTETMYGWSTLYPQGSFNIASPPEYSSEKEIRKHPLFFLPNSLKYSVEHSFAGWIVIIYQDGLTETAHNYYDDLNKQLDSEGKIFDPLYVQARSNIKCQTDQDRIILGDFEISASTETRYYLRYISEKNGFILRPIDERYEIPFSGEQLAVIPEFWQFP